MRGIHFGTNRNNGKQVHLPLSSFDTHYHLIGGTGKGKTTALLTILFTLMSMPYLAGCIIVIDRLGGLSRDLLLWMSSPFCPQHVRDRLVYVQPSNEERIAPVNPLLYSTPGEGYYKVAHAVDIILRGWASQSVTEQPRLARWLFNCFWSAAQLGLTIADCVHFLLPHSGLHTALLELLPDQLRAEWGEIYGRGGGQSVMQLESTRNRLRPVFTSRTLKNIFGSSINRLDFARFMREDRVVILNLEPGGRIPEQVADAIGGLAVNEVMSVARSRQLLERRPVYLVLDEFQAFVSPDLQAAIPEVRQLGVKLLLSHQSLSQLERGETDLTSLIFQCQSRLIFGVQGEDADVLANELASLRYDPRKIKDEVFARRQRLTGHKIVDLQSTSFTDQEAASWSRNIGRDWRFNTPYGSRPDGRSEKSGESLGGSRSHGQSHGTSQHLLPQHEEYQELVNRTYFTFEEDVRVCGRDIRRLERGRTFLRLVDDQELYDLNVKRTAPGHLAWSHQQIARFHPGAFEAMDALIEKNFEQEFFVSPERIEQESRERLERILRPGIVINTVADAPVVLNVDGTPVDENPYAS